MKQGLVDPTVIKKMWEIEKNLEKKAIAENREYRGFSEILVSQAQGENKSPKN